MRHFCAMNETIRFERTGHIARLVLNNPGVHNALGQRELAAMRTHLASLQGDSQVRVLVLTGWGDGTFCAGASLKELNQGSLSGDAFQAVSDQLAALPIPTVCAINGNVFGGGVELALSCDFRVGVSGMRLRVPAARIGLCYPASGIARFVERLGVSAAKRLLLAAEEFSGEDLLHLGFLDHLVLPSQLDRTAEELATRLASLAPLSVQAMKALIQQAARGGIDPDEAERLSRRCQESADLQEGFAAQRARREPRFSGS